MKKPRNLSSLNVKCQSNNNNIETCRKIENKCNKSARSFYELSLSLILSLWCIVFLFYSRLGFSHDNGGIAPPENGSISSPIACTSGMLSTRCNSTGVRCELVKHESVKPKYSLPETNGLEQVVWKVVGYNTLVCELQQEEKNLSLPEELPNGRTSHPSYLNFDEFKNITRKEKDRSMATNPLVNITHRVEPDGKEYDYASESKGAKVVAHNKEAKGASNILGKDHDKYLRNPCSVGEKFVVIELAEETLVDTVKIANFEHYSSNFKEFELSGSLSYPTETWCPLGSFVAANVKHIQTFKLTEPKWVRYLKLNLLGHYGSEFYCTLSVVEVYGVNAIERMLEDLIVAPSPPEPVPKKLLEPNTTEVPSLKPEVSPIDKKRNVDAQDGFETANVGTESINDVQKLNADKIENPVIVNVIPDPVIEVRQQPGGRIPGDTVLKILMQKVRSLELNLSVLEEYIKELNKRQGDALPELDRELLTITQLLEKCKTEIKNLTGWKEIMEKEFTDLQSWKSVVSSQVDTLLRENTMLRLDVEKIVSDQASLESKELSVLAVSLFFAGLAILKLISSRLWRFSAASQSDKVCRTNRGWVLILVSSSMTIFITLLCG